MGLVKSSEPPHGVEKLLVGLSFCALGVVINVLGSRIAGALGLTLYLDCVGTVLASLLGGVLPGVAVGYLTNLVNTVFDETALYYGVVNVVVALTASVCARAGWFRRPAGIARSVLALALVSGGLSCAITWGLYGFGAVSAISSPLARGIYGALGNAFAAQLAADLLVDLVDKALVVLVALALAHLLPDELKRLYDYSLWQQEPLTREEVRTVRRQQLRVVSLRTKLVAGVSIIMVVVGAVTIAISALLFTKAVIDQQAEVAYGIADIAAGEIDANRVDEFIAQGDAAAGYAQVEQRLAEVRDSFGDVQYVYVYQIREDGCHVVLDPDTAEEPGSDPGEVIPFDQAFEEQIDTLLAGGQIEPVISNESYGWLLSVYRPLFDDTGVCKAYVAVDVLMEHVRADGIAFLARVVSLFFAFYLLACTIVLWLAEYSIILPLDSMSQVMGACHFHDEDNREASVLKVCALDIHTGDEIELLYRSMERMVEDIVGYIVSSQEQAETIERMQSNLIMVMADLVESRDHYTGEHVRKTAAYTQVIMDKMREEGIYADELTDEFVSNVYHSAPLHDIGKIVVSDSVLNKPGRLTDDEFASMKGHTTAGAEIIEKAVDAVSEPTYLDEAIRLAEYHHERWNGTGYPSGLAGDDIPLSARIMAVADVFDALVSKRSYKDGMPIERALEIIRDGMGSHFDPQIAQAFLDAEDEVRRIAEEHGDDKGLQTHDVHDDEAK